MINPYERSPEFQRQQLEKGNWDLIGVIVPQAPKNKWRLDVDIEADRRASHALARDLNGCTKDHLAVDVYNEHSRQRMMCRLHSLQIDLVESREKAEIYAQKNYQAAKAVQAVLEARSAGELRTWDDFRKIVGPDVSMELFAVLMRRSRTESFTLESKEGRIALYAHGEDFPATLPCEGTCRVRVSFDYGTRDAGRRVTGRVFELEASEAIKRELTSSLMSFGLSNDCSPRILQQCAYSYSSSAMAYVEVLTECDISTMKLRLNLHRILNGEELAVCHREAAAQLF